MSATRTTLRYDNRSNNKTCSSVASMYKCESTE